MTAIGGPTLLVLLRASPIAPSFVYLMIGIPTLLFLWVIAAIFATVIATTSLRQRAWCRAVSAAILPVAVITVLVQPLVLIRLSNLLGDRVHFAVMCPYYLAQATAQPARSGPRLVVFNRGGMIWASIGVVYDEYDEVALPDGSSRRPGSRRRIGQS